MATQTEMFTRETNGAAVTLPPHAEKDFRAYIHDQPERGEFTVDRSIFTDPDIFDLEMRPSSRATGSTSRMRASFLVRMISIP